VDDDLAVLDRVSVGRRRRERTGTESIARATRGCKRSSARFSRAAAGSSNTSAGALARPRICACVISASTLVFS
jgi:hypothetical protein